MSVVELKIATREPYADGREFAEYTARKLGEARGVRRTDLKQVIPGLVALYRSGANASIPAAVTLALGPQLDKAIERASGFDPVGRHSRSGSPDSTRQSSSRTRPRH